MPGEDIAPGVEIGTLQTSIDGTSVLDWFTAFVDGTAAWENLVDEGVE